MYIYHHSKEFLSLLSSQAYFSYEMNLDVLIPFICIIRIEHDDESENWNMLVDSLFEAATAGSAIIFTSNPDDSLLVPHANHTFHLGLLSSENSWSIFLVHAFGQK